MQLHASLEHGCTAHAQHMHSTCTAHAQHMHSEGTAKAQHMHSSCSAQCIMVAAHKATASTKLRIALAEPKGSGIEYLSILQAWQVGLGLGKAKARRLYQCLAHWRGCSLRCMWGIWRSSVQETSQKLLRAEMHWLASHRSATLLLHHVPVTCKLDHSCHER